MRYCINRVDTVEEVRTLIELKSGDSKPLYEQVLAEFKRLIVSGALLSGSKLPSVRELATQLTMNPNTIARAYRELETMGYCYSVPGKGSFVSEGQQQKAYQQQQLLAQWLTLSKELLYWGLDKTELLTAIEKMEVPHDSST